MPLDPFIKRVVGRRQQRPLGQPPSGASTSAWAKMANYRTRAPKGVFRYQNHAEANQDRLKWLLDAMDEKARGRR